MSTRVCLKGIKTRESETNVEHFFNGYGRMLSMFVNPTGYKSWAFIEFDNRHSADRAVNELNGTTLNGERVTLEYDIRPPGWFLHLSENPLRFMNFTVHNERYRTTKAYTPHRLIIENLSSQATWRDVRDHFCQVAEVTFADAHKKFKNQGIVGFPSPDELQKAYDIMDGTEIKGKKINLIDISAGSTKKTKATGADPQAESYKSSLSVRGGKLEPPSQAKVDIVSSSESIQSNAEASGDVQSKSDNHKHVPESAGQIEGSAVSSKQNVKKKTLGPNSKEAQNRNNSNCNKENCAELMESKASNKVTQSDSPKTVLSPTIQNSSTKLADDKPKLVLPKAYSKLNAVFDLIVKGDHLKIMEVLKSSKPFSVDDYATLNQSLIQAVLLGKVLITQILVYHGADVHYRQDDSSGRNSLHIAAEKGFLDIGFFLIKCSNLDERDRHGNTALHLCQQGPASIQMTKLLINGGSSVHSENNDGETPLFKALQSKNLNVIRLLCMLGIKSDKKKSVLEAAKKFNLDKMVDALTSEESFSQSHETNINDSQKSMDMALFGAVLEDDIDSVKRLINYGANPRYTNVCMKNLLHYAAERGNCDMVKIFLAYMNVNSADRYGNTALHFCCLTNCREVGMVKLLVSRNANINAKNVAGETPLICATWWTRDTSTDFVQALISAHAVITKTDKKGWNAQTHAKNYGTDPVKKLINREKSRQKKNLPDAGNNQRNVPILTPSEIGTSIGLNDSLFDAVKKGDVSLVEDLLFRGAEIRTMKYGKNCLHIAAERGLADLVYMMNMSPQINTVTTDGMANTVFHLCQHTASATHITDALIKTSYASETVCSNTFNVDGETALMKALESRNVSAVLHLQKLLPDHPQVVYENENKKKQKNKKFQRKTFKNPNLVENANGLTGMMTCLDKYNENLISLILVEAIEQKKSSLFEILLATQFFNETITLGCFLEKRNLLKRGAYCEPLSQLEIEMLTKLMDNGADIFSRIPVSVSLPGKSYPRNNNASPLCSAAELGDCHLIKTMLAKTKPTPENMHMCDHHKMYFEETMVKVVNKNSHAVLEVLKPFLEVLYCESSIETLLDKALEKGHMKCVSVLLPLQKEFDLLKAMNMYAQILVRRPKSKSKEYSPLSEEDKGYLSMLLSYEPVKRITSSEPGDHVFLTAIAHGDHHLLSYLMDVKPDLLGGAEVYVQALAHAARKNDCGVLDIFDKNLQAFSASNDPAMKLNEVLSIGLENGHCDFVLKLFDFIDTFDLKEALSMYFMTKVRHSIKIDKCFISYELEIRSDQSLSDMEINFVKTLIQKGSHNAYNVKEDSQKISRSPILLSVAIGDLSLLKLVLEKCPYLCLGNTQMYTHATALVALHGRLDMLEILSTALTTLSFPRKKKKNLNQPLLAALKKGDTQCTSFLLNIMKSFDLDQALSMAAETGNETLYKMVKDKHFEHFGSQAFDKMVKGRLGTRWLTYACKGDNLSIVRGLLSAGAPTNDSFLREKQPLTFCCSASVAEVLLTHGANVNWHYKEKSALRRAALLLEPNFKLVEILVKFGATASLCLVADLLTHPKTLESIRMLVLNCDGYDPSQVDKFGRHALSMAVKRGFKECAEILVSKGADVNFKPATNKKDDSTPLIEAVRAGHADVVDLLLESKADVNVKCNNGFSAVTVAAKRGYATIIEMLAKKGADLDVVSENTNHSPLYLAFNGRHLKCFAALIKAGANVEREENGKTLMVHLLDDFKRPKYIIEFLRNGAKIPPSKNYNYLVHKCITTNNLGILSALINHGGLSPVVMNDEPEGILSPFCLALLYGRLQLAKEMVKAFYLTESDIYDAPTNETLKQLIEQNSNSSVKEDSLDILNNLSCTPLSLKLLSFVKVSEMIGPHPSRVERLELTGLPPFIKKSLLFSHKDQKIALDALEATLASVEVPERRYIDGSEISDGSDDSYSDYPFDEEDFIYMDSDSDDGLYYRYLTLGDMLMNSHFY